MTDPTQAIGAILSGRCCLVGVGNVDHGDDGVGVRLAESLCAAVEAEGAPRSPKGTENPGARQIDIIVAGAVPERHLGRLAEGGYDTVLFIDAVDFGGEAGSAVLLDASEIAVRFPQVSTHKISIGALASFIGATGRTRVYLLGLQPCSLRPEAGLTAPVRQALDALSKMFLKIISSDQPEWVTV